MYARTDEIRLALLALDIDPDTSAPTAGRLLNVNGKTVTRALAGGIVSEVFIANTLAAFRANADRLTRLGLELTVDQFFVLGAPADEPEPIGAVA